MGYNSCKRCGNGPYAPGIGRIHDPAAPWWKFWRMIECPDCGGDGMQQPPGWPDEAEIRRLRPPNPPAPPIPRNKTPRELAIAIVQRLQRASSPQNSTWGLEYYEAHANLFGDYWEDLVESVTEEIQKA